MWQTTEFSHFRNCILLQLLLFRNGTQIKQEVSCIHHLPSNKFKCEWCNQKNLNRDENEKKKKRKWTMKDKRPKRRQDWGNQSLCKKFILPVDGIFLFLFEFSSLCNSFLSSAFFLLHFPWWRGIIQSIWHFIATRKTFAILSQHEP